MQESQIQSLGGEDPLEKGMATHSSCLENPMDRGGWWGTVHGVTKSWTQMSAHTYIKLKIKNIIYNISDNLLC